MKILLLMKSEVAYQHLRKKFENHYLAPFVSDEQAFRNVLGNFNADVAVIDIQLPWVHVAEEILERFGVIIIRFEGDFDSAIMQVQALVVDEGEDNQVDQPETDEHNPADYIPHIDIGEPVDEPDPFVTKKKDTVKSTAKYPLPDPRADLVPKVPVEQPKEELAADELDTTDKKTSRRRIKREEEPKPITITKTEFAVLPSRMIVVGGLYPGAGSSFVSMQLARTFAAHGIPVTYVESPLNPKPYAFDALYLANVLEDETGFQDMGKSILDQKNQRKDTEIDLYGVKWIVKDPQVEALRGFTYEMMMRFVYAVKKTPIVIWDISNTWMDESITNILPQADDLFLVVDPDPVKLDWPSNSRSQEAQILELLKSYQSYLSYSIIANKDNEGVSRSTWEQCLTKKPEAYVPFIDAKYIYKALWAGKMPYDQDPVKAKLDAAFLPLMKKMLPERYLQTKEKSSLLQLFRKRK